MLSRDNTTYEDLNGLFESKHVKLGVDSVNADEQNEREKKEAIRIKI